MDPMSVKKLQGFVTDRISTGDIVDLTLAINNHVFCFVFMDLLQVKANETLQLTHKTTNKINQLY